MNVSDLVALAAANVGGDMQSSAQVCLDDARKLAAMDKPRSAAMWACKSLAYSVGVFHPAYRQAAAVYDAM